MSEKAQLLMSDVWSRSGNEKSSDEWRRLRRGECDNG